ncbi:hypothetical protein VNO77_04218 [Canavalia gladiata]|uniref:Uncharacterized protein n=1 Tax=Canavalia gladiata TaxID=3824 RepID=A0AAN9R7K3_CANGL
MKVPIKILGRPNPKLLDRRKWLFRLKEANLRTPLEAAHQGSDSVEFAVRCGKDWKQQQFERKHQRMAKRVQYETPTLLLEVITVVITTLLSLEGLLAPTAVTKPSELSGGGDSWS